MAAGKTEVPIFVVDAFTTSCFSGNPAAVCLLPGDAAPSDSLLKAVAAEMNLSETAFVQPLGSAVDDADGLRAFREDRRFRLRWFTPTNEVNLCGHATIAAASVLLAHPVLHPAAAAAPEASPATGTPSAPAP